GGTLTATSVSVTGTGNSISSGTVVGNASQAAGSALTINGTLNGTDNLAAGATTLSGTGTVGVVTVNGGGSILSSLGTLPTGGRTLNVTNNTKRRGTIAGNAAQNAASALIVNGILSGTDSLSAGLTSLSG